MIALAVWRPGEHTDCAAQLISIMEMVDEVGRRTPLYQVDEVYEGPPYMLLGRQVGLTMSVAACEYIGLLHCSLHLRSFSHT